MSYQEALRVAIANELCGRQPYGDTAVHPNDIEDIEVRWDNGDRYNPTYGGDNEAPTFEVSVTLKEGPGRRGGERRTASIEVVFGALLKAVLETEL